MVRLAPAQELRAKVTTAHQLAMMPLEEQLEGLQKAIVTAQGLKRRNIQAEIEVRYLMLQHAANSTTQAQVTKSTITL